MTSLGAVATMAAGDLGTCALDAAGARSCWGESVGADRFGLGVTGSQLAPYADPGGPYDGVAVGARGSGRACVVRAADGALLCWTETASESPPGAFLQVDALQHVCAVRTDGRVACWGHNAFRTARGRPRRRDHRDRCGTRGGGGRHRRRRGDGGHPAHVRAARGRRRALLGQPDRRPPRPRQHDHRRRQLGSPPTSRA
ncbi:MAG: hypothetical protein M5U28_43135 [Sandaracinaceae bacterium]|nr:hypothetical protein [Sandaracinaceae bacterium]